MASDRSSSAHLATFADPAAVLADFHHLGTIGATGNGGVERQAATAADGEQRTWLRDWLTARGFRVVNDQIGNQFGLYEFTPGAPYIIAGSHLDSQPKGGKYDGAYGVLAAAHAADRIRQAFQGATPEYNIGVVNWFNEEGSRFKPSMMGSGVFTGKIPLATALASEDPSGVSAAEALGGLGELGTTDVFGAPNIGPDGEQSTVETVAGYAEIHIEQGPALDKEGLDIGLVTSTWAANKYEIAVVGAQAHTGSAPMPDRHDALYGAALAVVAVRELADRYAPAGDDEEVLHTSCGQLTVFPNSPVVVPSDVHMHFDLRSSDQEILDSADAWLLQRFAEIEVTANVKIEKKFAHTWKESSYHAAGVELAKSVADDLGLSNRTIRTLAGHDSTNMKDIVPTVMLFLPSVDGISHNEIEFTKDEDLVHGVDLLTGTLAQMVEGALG